MSVYTVHEPPLRGDEVSPNPDRFVFVRDGFYFWAFLFAAPWMLVNRLWLSLFLYLVLSVAVTVGLWAIGADAGVQTMVALLIALLIGIEAGTLRRWKLARRGYRNVGVVVGEDLEEAERRFFTAWTAAEPTRPSSAHAPSSAPSSMPPSAVRMTPPSPEIIGLFPEPGVRR